MVRELRKRKSRPNYASLDDEDAPEPGPSHQAGSDFELDRDAEAEDDNEDVQMSIDQQSDDEIPRTPSRPSRKTPAGKKKAKSVISTPGPRQASQTISTPSIHHRHRALPIYKRRENVERLSSRPELFRHAEIVSTNSGSSNGTILDRVGKAWGYNVGSGPLWDLMEDRGWYKEAGCGVINEQEASRRPRVYQDVKIVGDLGILSRESVIPCRNSRYLLTLVNREATPYLPTGPPLCCSFGPISGQTQVYVGMFDTVKIGSHVFLLQDGFSRLKKKNAQTHSFPIAVPMSSMPGLQCGASTGARYFLKIEIVSAAAPSNNPSVHDRAARSIKQYLAVGPTSSASHTLAIGSPKKRPIPACIQIWSLSPSGGSDSGTMTCEMVLCIESGCAHELRWCPLPSHDPFQVCMNILYIL